MDVRWTFSVAVGIDVSVDELMSHVEEVMKELVKLEEGGTAISSSAVSLDVGERTVLVELEAEGATYPEAAEVGLSAIRAAVHAAGGFTGGWPTMADVLVLGDSNMSMIEELVDA